MKCPTCNGTGIVKWLLNKEALYDGWEEPQFEECACDVCGGSGKNEPPGRDGQTPATSPTARGPKDSGCFCAPGRCEAPVGSSCHNPNKAAGILYPFPSAGGSE